MIKKLKQRWKITSNWQLFLIIIVFSLTGSIAVKLAKPILHAIHVDEFSVWIYWTLRILIIFPLYQILLIIVGSLLGQFNFFWNFEKKMLRRFGLKFKEDKISTND